MSNNIIFSKYSSIENSYREKNIIKIESNTSPNLVWVGSEKIHGANFSFITNGIDVVCGKRSGFISKEESFFSSHIVFEKYKDNVIILFKMLKEHLNETINQIQVYGELFGGSSNNLIQSKISKVQDGVFYTPDLEFMGFDILINNQTFLPLSICNEYLSNVQIPICPILVKGTLRECLKFSPKFLSEVAKSFGYNFENNFAEGLVIRPFEEEIILARNSERVILKNKYELFSENMKCRSYKEPKEIENKGTLSEWISEIKEKYINLNRYNSLVSKIGLEEVEMKNFGKILGMYLNDILNDFVKDKENEDIIDRDVSYMKGAITPFVREFLLGIIRK